MKSVRNHLALILPLFAILFAVEYLLVLERVVQAYENRLKEQYSVIVVADRSVKSDTIGRVNGLIENVEPVDAEKVLMRIRKQVSKESLEKLQAVMPAFYTVKLRRYPDKKSLERLKNDLLSLEGVKRVKVFEKVHDPLYAMLAFMKSNVLVFAILLGITGFLLIIKQMYIWQLEHKERMQIMALFGAPVWLRSGVLFRLAIVDAIISLLLAGAMTLYLMTNSTVRSFLYEIDMRVDSLVGFDDFGLLAAVALGMALMCAFWVVVRFKEES
ncbi:cell division protein FtsX [Hydrogenimonas cancrithermarum]|uniref:Cell division protein FtsX n=1 Tax=Hydrogenimonas cancrithermarum TaxID=2993563 RepID=A0ABN6WX95_9BACT|nr:hypothetical protein [Hydrogenimonas cancrithermarum]BDY13894.1 hypothetical protein HCR_22060 [Hydrogenimonas cancrithermarum]